MSKFQQGGANVFDPMRVPLPEVGSISASPVIDIPTPPRIDVGSMSNMSISPDVRRRQAEADAIKQQSQLANAQKEFYSLQDDLVGNVHNEYQKSVLDRAKAKYGIGEDFYASVNTSDYFQLRNETDKIYKFMKDPEVLQVIGEVQMADELMSKLPAGMSQEDYDDWNNYRMNVYQKAKNKGEYDVRLLDPRGYKRPVAKEDPIPKMGKDILPTLSKIGQTIDLSNDAEIERAGRIMADQWSLNYGQAAVDAGLITYPTPGGRAQLTPEGEAMVLDNIGIYRNDYMTKREDKIEDATTMAQTRDALADQNRADAAARKEAEKKAGAGKKTSPIKNDDDGKKYEAAWQVFLDSHPEYSFLDPWDLGVSSRFGAVVNNDGEVSLSKSAFGLIADRLDEYIDSNSELRIKKAQRLGEDTARKLNPNAPQTPGTPPATTPSVPAPESGAPTADDVFKNN